MKYDEEDKEDKKYKKSYGRKEFKKDVAEAVKPELEKAVKKKKPPPKPAGGRSRSSYAKMKVSELRKHLNDKKKALLVKSGFPEGTVPRSKEAMISLCVKLKRKRW